VQAAKTDKLEEDLLVALCLDHTNLDTSRRPDQSRHGIAASVAGDSTNGDMEDELQMMEGVYIEQLHRRALVLNGSFQEQVPRPSPFPVRGSGSHHSTPPS
jgi:hypothetical protein